MNFKVTGVDEVDAILSQIAPRQAMSIMRSTIHGVAGGISKDAKKHMSKDTGTMIRSTKPKRERVRFGKISSTVRVGPKAYYWRFREYGQGPDGVEDAMFMKAVAKFRAEMDRIFREQFGKKFEAALVRARKAQG